MSDHATPPPLGGSPAASGWEVPPHPGPIAARPSADIGALFTAGKITNAALGGIIASTLAELLLTPAVIAHPGGAAAVVMGVMRLALLVAVVGSAAGFMTWLYIATKNLKAWGGSVPWGPGWAIGAWFIPLANLYLPFAVVAQAARASAAPPDVHSTPQPARSGLVVAWWVTFLVGSCTSNQASKKSFATSEGGFAFGYLLPSTLLYLVAAVLGILVIQHITHLQNHRQVTLEATWR